MKYLGRKAKEIQNFKVKGTFKSMYAAQGWLKENGYSYGSTCVGSPVAIVKGEDYFLPEKWHNINAKGKRHISGVMTSNDWREGDVTVIIFQ